jgi:hypothetical protein
MRRCIQQSPFAYAAWLTTCGAIVTFGSNAPPPHSNLMRGWHIRPRLPPPARAAGAAADGGS